MAKLTQAQLSYVQAWSSNPSGYNASRRAVSGRGQTRRSQRTLF